MQAKRGYSESLQERLGALIEDLELPDVHKGYLRARWLDQVVWMESAADKAKARYFFLRLVTIIGGVIVPALVSLNVAGNAASLARWATFTISLLVAISAAVEEFFHYGERWRHYRRTVELLKSEGWEFLQQSGRYRRYGADRMTAYRAFATRVEEVLRQDIEAYVTAVIPEKEDEERRERSAQP